jgi:hypothetical protein
VAARANTQQPLSAAVCSSATESNKWQARERCNDLGVAVFGLVLVLAAALLALASVVVWHLGAANQGWRHLQAMCRVHGLWHHGHVLVPKPQPVQARRHHVHTPPHIHHVAGTAQRRGIPVEISLSCSLGTHLTDH